MIDPKQLRIGNYVSTEVDKFIQVEGVGFEEVIICGDSVCDKFIEPIPITEEWLLKFEFVKTSYGYESLMPTIEFNFVQRLTGVHLVYVHQLQNLYHAITGKELQVSQNTKS